ARDTTAILPATSSRTLRRRQPRAALVLRHRRDESANRRPSDKRVDARIKSAQVDLRSVFPKEAKSHTSNFVSAGLVPWAFSPRTRSVGVHALGSKDRRGCADQVGPKTSWTALRQACSSAASLGMMGGSLVPGGTLACASADIDRRQHHPDRTGGGRRGR